MGIFFLQDLIINAFFVSLIIVIGGVYTVQSLNHQMTVNFTIFFSIVANWYKILSNWYRESRGTSYKEWCARTGWSCCNVKVWGRTDCLWNISVGNARLSAKSSARFDFLEICRTIKMKLTLTTKVFDLKCPNLEVGLIIIILLHILSSVFIGNLVYLFLFQQYKPIETYYPRKLTYFHLMHTSFAFLLCLGMIFFFLYLLIIWWLC